LVFNRERIGEGETFELVVLDGAVVPGPTQPPPVVVGPPPGPAPEPSARYVAAVKAQLEAEGADLAGPCGAFRITQRVAWGLRSTGVGLLSKPSGNQCDGYSVDYLIYPTGDGVDILGDAGGRNLPQWADKPGEFRGEIHRWRAPVQP
jgi:hypothetical protein